MADHTLSDTCIIMLLKATERSDSTVFPFHRPEEPVRMEKALAQLLRRNYIKRVTVEGIRPYHRQVRGVGCVNYVVTEAGLQAVNL